MKDLDYYNRERKQDTSGDSTTKVPSMFILECQVSDVVGLDYLIPVQFCEDIVEGTFEAKILVDLCIQASDLFSDINLAFHDKVKRVSYKLIAVYDNFNQEIK